ncbi:SH3 domain-containing protein [Euzebya sp.]|uniref:SH3 domain-containing protein n=1 Tax=Euzebya sp. TaxID=1971409 RepID=UPI003512F55D
MTARTGGGGGARHLRHLLVGALVAVAVGAVAGIRLPAADVRAASSFVTADVRAGGHVVIAVVDPADNHVVDLRYGSRRTSFGLSAGDTDAVVAVPVLAEGADLQVEVEPGAPITVRPHAGPADTRVRWTPVRVPTELPAPIPLDPATGFATAAVDETDTYGLRPRGVALRTAPSTGAPVVEEVFHGEILRARCWARGDVVGDGHEANRRGEYVSDVWIRVRTWADERAWIPDTRFARTGAGGLGLPPCAELS